MALDISNAICDGVCRQDAMPKASLKHRLEFVMAVGANGTSRRVAMQERRSCAVWSS